MKDPGPIKVGSEAHLAANNYANSLVKRFGMAAPAALGQVIRFDEAIRRVAKTKIGMASLIIEIKDEE